MLFEDGIYTALLKGAWYRGVCENGIGVPLTDLWMKGEKPLIGFPKVKDAQQISFSKGIKGYQHIFKELAKNPLYVAVPLMTIMGGKSFMNIIYL